MGVVIIAWPILQISASIAIHNKVSYHEGTVSLQPYRWISSWLTERTQQVVVDGDYSTCKQVRSGVPQGTVLGPLMFLHYINDIGDNLKHSPIRLFADDCLLYTTISNQDDADRLQDDLDKLQEWTDNWQMNLNAKKCYRLSMHLNMTPH